ncbi:peptidase M30 [Leptospira stimsonii]|uniref:Peptidase M30 n=1 Tax=Leptospira stimsonii TaxID=2202203 RepID=A0A4R9L2Q1_9LEPT|nr:peptidase M30 [Leptospira stimsonii]RHX83440.1 peptidase M30 [Leptospira stimsonii]TGK20502.1 peptidase M30 [Leptospira stimsonii]TGM14292.1 peptidase M30 [Leptospira stimsonii]
MGRKSRNNLGFFSGLLFSLFFLNACSLEGVFPTLFPNEKQKLGAQYVQALILTAVSCSGPGKFWVRDITKNASYCLQASLVGEGDTVSVYAESGQEQNLDYKSIVREFDQRIFPKLGAAFGPPSDMDQSGKVHILFLDIRDGSKPGGSFVAGFFDPYDFLSDDPRSSVRSNGKEILYIDSVQLKELADKDLASGKSDTLLSTIAHEFQHLIRFQYELPEYLSQKARDETWLNEGTSEVASDIAGYSPQMNRIQCYRGNVAGVCARGVNGSTIFGSANFSSVVDYSFAYAFMKYLYTISGSNLEERNSFFKKTVSGSSVRAKDAQSLAEIFLTSAGVTSLSASQKNDLGISGETSFIRLFAAFLWLSTGESTLAEAQLGVDSAGAAGFKTGMESVLSAFPFPPANQDGGELRKLYDTQPLPFILPLSNLKPGQFHFIDQNRSNTGTQPAVVLLKKTVPSLRILQVNADPYRLGQVSQSVTRTEDEGEPVLLPETDGPEIICPIEYFHSSDRSRTN